jgi:hypothetical protein
MAPGTKVTGLEIKSVKWKSKEKYLIEDKTLETVEGPILTLMLLAINNCPDSRSLPLISGATTRK